MITAQTTLTRPAGTSRDLRVHDLFQDHVAHHPHDVALVDDPGSSTYADLDTLTNRLARSLQLTGVGPDVVVGCYLQHGPARVVHILAILKAGGAYLLLNPHLPAARLRYLVTDAAPATVIHDRALPALVSSGARATLSVTELTSRAAHLSCAPVSTHAHPDSTATLTYIAGANGRPQRVTLTHREVLLRDPRFAATPGEGAPHPSWTYGA